MGLRSRGIGRIASWVFCLSAAGFTAASAEDLAARSVVSPGALVVSGFSGSIAPLSPPAAGADPVDQTFIDLNGPSMRVLHPQPAGAPAGQAIPAPSTFSLPASKIGQVFAITLDDAASPSIFLGATSAYGLSLVTPDADGDGHPERSRTGAPGATFMPGQWGEGGGPGTIYRVDGTDGAVSIFANIANSGPGIGDVVFDPTSRGFYASDLDTGLILRIDGSGAIVGSFDHGVDGRPAHGLAAVPDDAAAADITGPAFDSTRPATWGFTAKERRVGALAVRDGRLYYAVADAPSVWSVGLGPDGKFAGDPRWEFDVSGAAAPNAITDMLFDGMGRLLLAQRGDTVGSYDFGVLATPGSSEVLRYRRDASGAAKSGVWLAEPESYAIGLHPAGNNASGGIALGYAYNEIGALRERTCGQFLWSSGDALRNDPDLLAELASPGPSQVQGLQGNDRELLRPANDPPLIAYFVDIDGAFEGPARSGDIGDVEAYAPCVTKAAGPVAPPVVVLAPPPTLGPANLVLDKVANPADCALDASSVWQCKYAITLTNAGPSPVDGTVQLSETPAPATLTSASPPWKCDPAGTCTLTDHIEPGDKRSFVVTTSMPAATLEADKKCSVENTVAIVQPAGGSTQNSNPGDDSKTASARALGKNCDPTKADLTIRKEPFNCAAEGSTQFVCDFKVTIKNEGLANVPGPVTFVEDLEFLTGYVIFDGVPAAVTCTPGATNYTCTFPGGLAAGASQTITVETAGKPADGVCQLHNSATILTPAPGTDLNTNGPDFAPTVDPIPSAACNQLPTTQSNLAIEKHAVGDCSLKADTVACEFRITVTNTGPDEYRGLVIVADPATLAGVTKFTADDPSWTCKSDSCDGAIVLKAGESTGVSMHFETALAVIQANGCKLENTATINRPTGAPLNLSAADDKVDPPAVATLPASLCGQTALPTNLLPTIAAGTCTSDASAFHCTYDLTVTNDGPGTFVGKVTVRETSPNVGHTISVDGVDAPLVCKPGATPAETFCDITIASLAPKAASSFKATITVPMTLVDAKDPTTCTVQNDVAIVSPVNDPQRNSKTGDDSAGIADHLSCETNLSAGVSGEAGSIVADVNQAGECAQSGPGTDWICPYQSFIANTGVFAVKGPVKFRVGHNADFKLVAGIPPGVTCDPVDPASSECTISSVPVGTSVISHFDLHISTAEWFEMSTASCKVILDVRILDPLGKPFNGVAIDDEMFAVDKVPMIPEQMTGGQFQLVPCDPPGLSLEKTPAPEGCQKTAAGFNCPFDIKVVSTGTAEGPIDPYPGNLVVSDAVSNPGTSLSVPAQPPWVCNPDKGAEVTCTYPQSALPLDPKFNVGTLVVGDSRTLRVVVSVPDALPRQGYCKVSNDASVKVRDTGTASDHAEMPIDSPFCNLANACPEARQLPGGGCCANGQVAVNGTCAIRLLSFCPTGSSGTPPNCYCPDGTRVTPVGGASIGGPLARSTCAPLDNPNVICPVDSTPAANGRCLCPDGRYATGKILRCPAPKAKACVLGSTPTANAGCLCPEGTVVAKGAKCPTSKPANLCPGNSTPTSDGCLCADGQYAAGNSLKCPPPKGSKIELKRCPGDSTGGFYPFCKCPGGRGTPGSCPPSDLNVPKTDTVPNGKLNTIPKTDGGSIDASKLRTKILKLHQNSD